jgi:single-strand DNA-binding protein
MSVAALFLCLFPNAIFFLQNWSFSTRETHAQAQDSVLVVPAQGHDTRSMKSNPPPHDGVNEVHLVGCVSSLPTTKVLPSGDEVVEFRIVIDRKRRRGAKREVDSLELAAWNPREKRQALKLTPGQWVEIDGSVHRRFWSSPKGLASRWQIEVSLLRRM